MSKGRSRWGAHELVVSLMSPDQRVSQPNQGGNFAISAEGWVVFGQQCSFQRNAAGMVLRRIENKIPAHRSKAIVATDHQGRPTTRVGWSYLSALRAPCRLHVCSRCWDTATVTAADTYITIEDPDLSLPTIMPVVSLLNERWALILDAYEICIEEHAAAGA